MRPSRRFRLLQAATEARLYRLRKVAVEASLAFPAPHGKLGIAFATVELLNTWTEFVRSYFLSCILRPVRIRGGRVVATLFTGTTFNDAIGVAMARHKRHTRVPASGIWPRRDEPAWHDPHILRTSCADIGCSNLSDIEAALSMPTRALTDLPVYRNFFGHRNHATAASARNLASHYGIPGYRHPREILKSLPSRRPEPLVVDWIDDVNIIVEFLCH